MAKTYKIKDTQIASIYEKMMKNQEESITEESGQPEIKDDENPSEKEDKTT